MAGHLDIIARKIADVRRRATVIGIAEGLAIGLFHALVVATVGLAVRRLCCLVWLDDIGPFILVFIVLASAVFGWRRRRLDAQQATLAIDETHNLRERVTTAWLMRGDTTEFARLIQSDAALRVRNMEAKPVVPWLIERPWRIAIPAFLLLVATLLPEADLLGVRARQIRQFAEEQTLETQIARLQRESRRVADEIEAPQTEALAYVTKEMKRLEDELASSRKSARAAARDIAEAAENIAREHSKAQSKADSPRLEGPRSQTADFTADLEQALKSGDLEQAESELVDLQQQATSGQLSNEDMSAIAGELEHLSKAVAGDQGLTEAFADAADAMQSNNIADAAKHLEQARAELTEAKRVNDELDEVKRSLEALKLAKNGLLNFDGKDRDISKRSSRRQNDEQGDSESRGDRDNKKSDQNDESDQGDSQESKFGEKSKSGNAEEQDTEDGKSADESEKGKSRQGDSEKGKPGKGKQGDKPGDKKGGKGKGGKEASEDDGKGAFSSESATIASASKSSQPPKGGAASMVPGANPGGDQAGKGTTSQSGGSSGAQDKAPTKPHPSRYSGDRKNWRAHFQQLYDADPVATEGEIARLKGKIGEGQSDGAVDVEGEVRRTESNVASRRVASRYIEAQQDALARERIPPAYKAIAKGYFESLAKE